MSLYELVYKNDERGSFYTSKQHAANAFSMKYANVEIVETDEITSLHGTIPSFLGTENVDAIICKRTAII